MVGDDTMTHKFAISNSISSCEIKTIRNKLGLSQKEFAKLMNVSVNTVEKWEVKDTPIKGSVVTTIKLLKMNPSLVQKLNIPPLKKPLRLYYMFHNDICTIIDVNEREKDLEIHNYVIENIYRAFGIIEHPTFDQYIEFLKSRCFPEDRDHLKLYLKELDIPFYEPMLIIEKTEGRIADDDFWIKIERKQSYDQGI